MLKGQRDNPSHTKHKISSHLSAPPTRAPFASGGFGERLVPSEVALLALPVPEQEGWGPGLALN